MSLFPIARGAKCLNLSPSMELCLLCVDGWEGFGVVSGWRWVRGCWEERRAWEKSFQLEATKGNR